MKKPFVLVAERSVLPTLDLVLEGLIQNGDPESIFLVVPPRDVEEFTRVSAGRALIVCENDVLPGWSLERVKNALKAHQWRAGWYYQQFLKLGFGTFSGIPNYVVWDADTVLLRSLKFTDRGKILVNASREFHPPYFETIHALFGTRAALKTSVISQYMYADTQVLQTMKEEIATRFESSWTDAILQVIPGRSLNEFSEYETYGNYLASRFPERFQLTRTPWFRYGADVMANQNLNTARELDQIRNRFRRFAYVVFERNHHASVPIRWARKLAWLLSRSA